MVEEILSVLEEGVNVDDSILSCGERYEGRLNRQYYTDVFLESVDEKADLMHLSVYLGKPPHYKPWVELFGIESEIEFSDEKMSYYGSEVEEKLLDLIAENLPPGGKVYIEYKRDEETQFGLVRGFHVPVTRLGNELFNRGFTWFKDWYFPEGFNEGGEKLQGEKPIDEEHREDHLVRIDKEIEEFLDEYRGSDEGYIKNAVERAEQIKRNR